MSLKNRGLVACLSTVMLVCVATGAQAGDRSVPPAGVTITAPPNIKTVVLTTYTGSQSGHEEVVGANCGKGERSVVRQDIRYASGHTVQYIVWVDDKNSFFGDVYLTCKGSAGKERYPIRTVCKNETDLVYRLRLPGRKGKFFVCSPSAPKVKDGSAESVSSSDDQDDEVEPEPAPGRADLSGQ